MTTRSKSDRRKQLILEAALEIFIEKGFESAAIGEICARSDSSVGSLYHHFGSKEGVAAELYLEGIRRVQEATLTALLACRSAEAGVMSLSESYLSWCEQHPKYARFLLEFRHAGFMGAMQAQLKELNRAFHVVLRGWSKPYVESGELPPVEPEIYAAILIAPSEQFARQWLAQRTRTEMESARRALARAAWHGLRALREE